MNTMLLMLVGAMLLSASAQTAGTISKIKLLIVEGASNHDCHHRLARVKGILVRDGSFDVDVSVPRSAANNPGDASPPDFSPPDKISLRP